MAFYRHFVEKKDFVVAVATDHPQVREFAVPHEFMVIEPPQWLKRGQRTRLAPWMHALQHFWSGTQVPQSLLKAARDFRPDVILTVAGSWSWTAELASRLARALNVPLAGSFNDWFDYNLILPRFLKPHLEKKFRRLYQKCDLALCTCEGMRDELGKHPNAVVHYPTGAPRADFSDSTPARGAAPFRILFGGNLGEWYGPMLEQLVMIAREQDRLTHEVEFVIHGSNPGWSSAFDRYARTTGIYRGQVSFAELQIAAEKSDGLLLLMGFGPGCAQIEKTSFKTKFLDYLGFQRPVMVWGPEYSSAVRTAREFDSAQVCVSAEPRACLETILDLSRNLTRQKALLANAARMYEDRFHPDKIHLALVSHLEKLVAIRSPQSS